MSRPSRSVVLLLLTAAACRPAGSSPGAATVSGPAIDSVLAEGEAVYLRGAYDTARTLWSTALEQSRAAHDTASEARSLTWLGLTAWRQGDYPTARRLGEAALALKRRLAQNADLFKSYNALGLLAWNEGRLADATELFGQAAAAARASEDRKGIAAAAGNLALVQTELGEFEEARRGFDSMRVAGRAIADPRIEGNALTNLGMLAVRVGDPGTAIPYLDSALARYRDAGYPTGEQNALGQLGTAYAALGQPHQALAMLDSALALSRRQGLKQDEASDLEAMAELYRGAGDPRRALDLYARAERINRELGLVVEAGADLRSLAEIKADAGALEEAGQAGVQALATHRAAEARYEELTDLLLLADLAVRSNRTEEGRARLDSARALAHTLRARRALADVVLAEAGLAERAGRPHEVLQVLADGRDVLGGLGYGMEEEALRLEAGALAQVGQLDSAAAMGRRAVAALERVRGGYGSGELRASYLAEKQGIYADLAEVLRRLGRTEEAFEVADASRGRTLVEGLASVRRDSSRGGERVLRQADDLLRTIAALSDQLRQAEPDTAGGADSSATRRVRFLAERLAAARQEYEELAVRGQEIGSSAGALLGSAQPPASEILSQLHGDETLVEYQPAADSLLIFIGRRGAVRVVAVPLPPGGLASRVRLARDLIASRSSDPERLRPVLTGLYQLLIAPARSTGVLEGTRTLVIVPHALLAYLPFAALVEPGSDRYLMDEFALLTLPSAASLAALRLRGGAEPGSSSPEIFAPDPARLPSTGVEATTLGRQMRGARVRLGRAASEAAARAALESGALVHLAAHGELNARNPMFSWIETTASRQSGSQSDGRLEVHEILGLRVRSPLVFLSGCETGLGATVRGGLAPGEDFATLGRAFLYAGARNVVATLWRVDDQGAAAFATEYYRRLEREGPAGALAGAQRTLAAGGRFAAPYYWAGYTLAGEGSLGAGARTQRVSVR